jgi:hypothetical protein
MKGQVTIDFLFASVLVLSVATLLMALTIALSLSEVLQYVSFSAARSYFAADENENDQVIAAEIKAHLLLTNGLPFLRGALNNGWIKITGGPVGPDNPRAKNYNSYAQNLGVPSQSVGSPVGGPSSHSQFTGYQIKFEIPILGLKLPLLGQAVTPPDGQSGFQATVSSMLMREPTHSECVNYTNKSYDTILRRNPAFGEATSHSTLKNFVAINDNGC